MEDMGRIFTTLVFVFLICKTTAQTTYVPDDNFEQALIDLGYDSPPLDNFVLTANIENVVMLNLNGAGINDLTGIEGFDALEILYCNDNNLLSINVGQNINLLELFVNLNNLTELDVANNGALRKLSCNFNNLLSLDMTQNPDLRYLACTENNLSSLDVTNNALLEELYIINNEITAIDFSQNVELISILLSQNQLNELDVSHNSKLEILGCDFNSLSSLDISQNLNLERMSCTGNEINVLDISLNNNLQYLDFNSNNLLAIDVSNNPNLISLRCGSNQISSLNVSQNTMLQYLVTDYGVLEQLDVSLNPNLKQLSCRGNQLESLNVKNGNNTNFQYFNALENPSLTCIEVDDVTYSEANWPDVDPQAEFSEDCNPLGIVDKEIDIVTIYPNPFSDEIYMETDQTFSSIEIRNVLGVIVYRSNAIVNSINLTGLSQGVYILKVTFKNRTSLVTRIIKN
ncbi:T9SS type A sorting domain-containing protein [Aequorivita sp. CIP111184]|uniref:T9SS type A sorting domain-containing protein n=1 Tax=Aequorivita sp. CIP111184 TaxID=2211356 RepID=UPI000DBC2CA3|nr:T9SS type A sorting domain-containing protein [Aequorivita sp. CIP111184]SRX56070.1 Internalin-J [Aequorivita sp. CIP111184]